MITFFNAFLTYLILTVASIGIIIAAVLLGKKLREIKDAKDAASGEGADGE